jgi:esterase/lipase
VVLVKATTAPILVTLSTDDGASIEGDLYGDGDRGVVLAHGARFHKESWAQQANALAHAGFRVVAINFRGYGKSRGPGQDNPFSAPLSMDVLAGVRYLKQHGARTVSVVGGSMGGGACADATSRAKPDEIDRLVVLGAVAGQESPDKIRGRKLFIATRDDAGTDGPRLPRIQNQFEQVPEPKHLLLLDGSAHAQFIFQTDQGERVMREIIQFLSEP